MLPINMHRMHTCVFDITLTPDSISCCVTAVEINVSKFRRIYSIIQQSTLTAAS